LNLHFYQGVGVMTKAELVKKIAKDAGITGKAADKALTAAVGAVHDSLKKKDGKIRIADLGTFVVAHRKARTGVNPQNKTKIKIPAKNVPRFRASKALKQAVQKAK
jgi:DNA-binding protein HU-beta